MGRHQRKNKNKKGAVGDRAVCRRGRQRGHRREVSPRSPRGTCRGLSPSGLPLTAAARRTPTAPRRLGWAGLAPGVAARRCGCGCGRLRGALTQAAAWAPRGAGARGGGVWQRGLVGMGIGRGGGRGELRPRGPCPPPEGTASLTRCFWGGFRGNSGASDGKRAPRERGASLPRAGLAAGGGRAPRPRRPLPRAGDGASPRGGPGVPGRAGPSRAGRGVRGGGRSPAPVPAGALRGAAAGSAAPGEGRGAPSSKVWGLRLPAPPPSRSSSPNLLPRRHFVWARSSERATTRCSQFAARDFSAFATSGRALEEVSRLAIQKRCGGFPASPGWRRRRRREKHPSVLPLIHLGVMVVETWSAVPLRRSGRKLLCGVWLLQCRQIT